MERIFRIELKGSSVYALRDDEENTWYRLSGDLFGEFGRGQVIEGGEFRLLAPVRPSKIVAVGLNYRDHAKEMNKPLPEEPLIFLKPSSAIIGHGDAIVLPPTAGRVDYEAELGIVIGRRAKSVPAEIASDYILGLTCVNDVTARELQAKDVQYTRAKGFDTFAPIGPCIVTGLDGSALDVESWVNGERRQASNTRELIFGLRQLVAFVSGVMTLLPGDVIATGTPSGVGPLTAGDQVVIKVEQVGELSSQVVAKSDEDGESKL